MKNAILMVRETYRDITGRLNKATDSQIHVRSALDWVCYAQDKERDGGIPAYYSFITGWAHSYIETTGYIIPTFLEAASFFTDKDLLNRSIRMADFLLEMQLPSGGFRTHVPSQKKIDKPTVFDTGQDIVGLVDIYKVTKKRKYLESAIRAGNYLCSIQRKDGSWVRYEYGNEPHTYNTRVAWALLLLYTHTKNITYKKYATRHLDWAMKNQIDNGWFSHNAFPNVNDGIPFTHNIAYAMEGFYYSGLLLRKTKYIEIVKKTADILLRMFNKDSYLYGAYDKAWRPHGRYTCLTGDAQLSILWLELFKLTKRKKYLYAARRMNNFLKTTQCIDPLHRDVSGAIKGSYPICGDIGSLQGYCRMAYCNWATKFFIDALLLEIDIRRKHTRLSL